MTYITIPNFSVSVYSCLFWSTNMFILSKAHDTTFTTSASFGLFTNFLLFFVGSLVFVYTLIPLLSKQFWMVNIVPYSIFMFVYFPWYFHSASITSSDLTMSWFHLIFISFCFILYLVIIHSYMVFSIIKFPIIGYYVRIWINQYIIWANTSLMTVYIWCIFNM